jgi:hypothetical protein
MVEIFAAKRHYKFRFENLTEFRDFLVIFLHVKSSQGDVPLFLPNDYFNHIIELSLNNAMKTEDQKRKTSESIFNSQITASNTPMNAIRRVILKPDGTRVAVGASSIVEDAEGEDEEEQAGPPAGKPNNQVEARADAEASSEDDQPQLPQMHPVKIEPPSHQSDDEDKKGKKGKKEAKDTKDKKVKEPKKDSKKDQEDRGYNHEELAKGKNMMSNPSFQANLEKLKTQFARSKGLDAPAASGGLKLGHSKKPSLSANPKTDPTFAGGQPGPEEPTKIKEQLHAGNLQESEILASDDVLGQEPRGMGASGITGLPVARTQGESSLKSGLGDSKGTNLRALAMQTRLSGEAGLAVSTTKSASSEGLKLGGIKLPSKPNPEVKKEPVAEEPAPTTSAGGLQIKTNKPSLTAAAQVAKQVTPVADNEEFTINRAPLNKKFEQPEDENAPEWQMPDKSKREDDFVAGSKGNTLTIKKPGMGKKSQLKQEEEEDAHNNSWDDKNPFD